MERHNIIVDSGDGMKKLNQFGDYDDVSNMSAKDWEYRWSLDQTKFHMPKVHPMLQKHIAKLTQEKNRQRIFVPLCGKTLDMKWLLDQGHEVVGNECADEACRQFFEEHHIPYTTEPLHDIAGVLYKSTDGSPITLYRCDCFHITSAVVGKFDCMWDRGGFVALPVAQRERYAKIIKDLMKDNGRYILDCFLLDNDKYGGPPFNCTEQHVKNCFDSYCTIEKIDVHNAFTKWQESWGISSFMEEVYLLQPK